MEMLVLLAIEPLPFSASVPAVMRVSPLYVFAPERTKVPALVLFKPPMLSRTVGEDASVGQRLAAGHINLPTPLTVAPVGPSAIPRLALRVKLAEVERCRG